MTVKKNKMLACFFLTLALVCYAHLPFAQLEGTTSFALLPPLCVSVVAVKLRVNVVSSAASSADGAAKRRRITPPIEHVQSEVKV